MADHPKDPRHKRVAANVFICRAPRLLASVTKQDRQADHEEGMFTVYIEEKRRRRVRDACLRIGLGKEGVRASYVELRGPLNNSPIGNSMSLCLNFILLMSFSLHL
jgi:hypothetical protein